MSQGRYVNGSPFTTSSPANILVLCSVIKALKKYPFNISDMSNMRRLSGRCRAVVVGISLSAAVSGCRPMTETGRPDAAGPADKAVSNGALQLSIPSRDAGKSEPMVVARADVKANTGEAAGAPAGAAKRATKLGRELRLEWFRALLEEAAAKGDMGLARTMLKKGADANAKNSRGETPYDVAMKHGHPKTAELLRANMAK